MSAQHHQCSDITESNLFIRPIIKIDTISAVQGLALMAGRFSAFKEVVVMIAGDISAELVDVLMVTFGSCFKPLSNKAMQAIRDMYTAAPSMGMRPILLRG